MSAGCFLSFHLTFHSLDGVPGARPKTQAQSQKLGFQSQTSRGQQQFLLDSWKQLVVPSFGDQSASSLSANRRQLTGSGSRGDREVFPGCTPVRDQQRKTMNARQGPWACWPKGLGQCVSLSFVHDSCWETDLHPLRIVLTKKKKIIISDLQRLQG